MENNLLILAEKIAREYHKGQKRWEGEDYITHLEEVVRILKEKGFDNDVLIVGWLHDILEDTKMTIEEIHKFGFGSFIIANICTITRDKDEDYLIYILKCSDMNIAKEVKIADLTHNLSNLKKGSLRDKYLLAKYILENKK